MIDYREIKNCAAKLQSGEKNVLREYLQHLFLKWFYRQNQSDHFLFKGGTALRIAYDSPRFSEDLDFSGIQNGKQYERILLKVMEQLEKEGINYSLEESKRTSGGWLAILEFRLFEKSITVLNEISFRKKNPESRNELISSEILPAYRAVLLAPKILIKEKISAALQRSKSRDLFDIYYILRDQRLRHHLEITDEERKKLVSILRAADERAIARDLKYLLPTSFHPVIQDLPKRLINELR